MSTNGRGGPSLAELGHDGDGAGTGMDRESAEGMMSVRAATPLLLMLLVATAIPAAGQAIYRPTPAPDVNAATADWYVAGDPLTFAGNLYYRAGVRVHFMPHEMARIGEYRGIPLYARTTLEPMSIVYVPVGRGLLQPYERRRDGDLAGTVGSLTPSFPVVRPGTDPVGTTGTFTADPRVVFVDPVLDVDSGPPAAAPIAATRLARAPGPRDGIFIVFEGRRWYSAGPPVRLDVSKLTRAGDRLGWPVYRRPGDPALYVPLTREPGAPLARYERR